LNGQHLSDSQLSAVHRALGLSALPRNTGCGECKDTVN